MASDQNFAVPGAKPKASRPIRKASICFFIVFITNAVGRERALVNDRQAVRLAPIDNHTNEKTGDELHDTYSCGQMPGSYLLTALS